MNQEDVRFVKDDRKITGNKKKREVPENSQNESLERKCKFCSRYHPFAKKSCPAWGTSGKNCGKLNHFAVCCQESERKVLSVDYTSEDEEYEYAAEIEVKEQVNALASSPHPYKVFATLLVNETRKSFS